jgi:hypothetical protein
MAMRNAAEAMLTRGPLGTKNFRQQLGRSVELGDPSKYGNRMTLVYTGATQVQGKAAGGLSARAAGDAMASVVQVTCTYRGANAANVDRPLTVRGRVDWGTDGHQSSSYFDWLNGTCIQVAGSFCQVVAEVVDVYAGADEAPTHSTTALVTVGATIALGASNRPAPTYTQQLRMLQDAAPALPTATLQIPRFARRLWWLGPQPTSVQWAAGPNVALVLGEVDPLGINTRQPYERPGPATHLYVVGLAGGATLNTLMWELVL